MNSPAVKRSESVIRRVVHCIWRAISRTGGVSERAQFAAIRSAEPGKVTKRLTP